MSSTIVATAENDRSFTSQRLICASEIRFSEVISALSVSLDITQGHPQGHSMRTALIGMRMAHQIELESDDQSALFYALLLKDLGCSSNAAKMSYLFGADDHAIKRSVRMIDWTKPTERLKHCWTNCATCGGTIDKLMTMASLLSTKPTEVRSIAEIRCDRGAEIARMLLLPEKTAAAIYNLDEHWNGQGNPLGLEGHEISLLGRICCLAQTVEVFFSTHGLPAALDVAQQRSGKWFDPELVDALLGIRDQAEFWNSLLSTNLVEELRDYEPNDAVLLADDACIDRVAEAFAMVVDAKSPWTYQHSHGVADIAVGVASQMGCTLEVQRDVRRAALLHDIGKLGVPNTILDKPGKPTDKEFEQIRKHPEYTQRILEQVDAFGTLANVAAAHHERLDGRGYHRSLHGFQIPWITRILTVADICEAMLAKRPYRDAMSWEQVYAVISKDAGAGVDPECLEALVQWHDRFGMESRVEAQISQVDHLLSELR